MTTPAYYCMHCPETFSDAATSNAHHDATGHHQHWKADRGFAARNVAPLAPRAEEARPRTQQEHDQLHSGSTMKNQPQVQAPSQDATRGNEAPCEICDEASVSGANPASLARAHARGHRLSEWDGYRRGLAASLREIAPSSDAAKRLLTEAADALERSTLGNEELWQIIRQTERNNYAAANSVDVGWLDATCAQLALENAELRAAISPDPTLHGRSA